MVVFAFSIENITFFIPSWHANYLLLNMAFKFTFHNFGVENDKFVQGRRYYQTIAKTQFACAALCVMRETLETILNIDIQHKICLYIYDLYNILFSGKSVSFEAFC